MEERGKGRNKTGEEKKRRRRENEKKKEKGLETDEMRGMRRGTRTEIKKEGKERGRMSMEIAHREKKEKERKPK